MVDQSGKSGVTRNVISAHSNFSEDIQIEKMFDRSGQPDERNSSNAQIRNGDSHVTSRPVSFTPHPIPGGMLRHSFVSPSRREGPPSIWDTHGVSVFADPLASSSAPYPQELHQWNSSEEPLHSSTVEKSERPEQDQDLRCQSGPSAKDSVLFSGGDSSKNYGADQQRLQISDLHFDKFPTPATFAFDSFLPFYFHLFLLSVPVFLFHLELFLELHNTIVMANLRCSAAEESEDTLNSFTSLTVSAACLSHAVKAAAKKSGENGQPCSKPCSTSENGLSRHKVFRVEHRVNQALG